MSLRDRVYETLVSLYKAVRKRKSVILALSCVVVFVTTYMLILPAFTLEKDKAAKQGGIDVPSTEQTDGDGAEKEADTTEGPAKPSAKSDSHTEITLQNDDNDDLAVAVEGTDSSLSKGMSVEVSEIDKDNKEQKEEYDSLYSDALKAVQEAEGKDKPSEFAFAKFYDLSLMDGKDEVEPDESVDVTISFGKDLQKELKVTDPGKVHIVHFIVDKETGETTPEVLDAEATDITVEKNKLTEATFTADSFSVFAVVYTVDFTWEAGGETYEFSIPGGGFISLYDLVKVIAIGTDDPATEKDEVQELVDNVESAEFSDPKLVNVSKVDEDTTVGAIKERLGLECEYSAELTKDQIAEIDAQKVNAGDWALISLKPFDSEETLTIKMKNGEQFVVVVKDMRATISSLDDLNGQEFVLVANGDAMLTATNHSDWRIDAQRINTSDNNALTNATKWKFERDGNTDKFYIKHDGHCLRISNDPQKGIWVEGTYATQALHVSLVSGKIRITDDYGNAINLYNGDSDGDFGRYNDNGPNEYFELYVPGDGVVFSGTHQDVGKGTDWESYTGAEDRSVPLVNGKVTLPKDITPPANYKSPTGETGWKLVGWYDTKTGTYYGEDKLGTEVSASADTVFYADWAPVSYNYGQDKDALGGVLHAGNDTDCVPDLSDVVTTEVFDFSTMFNINDHSDSGVHGSGTGWSVGNNDYAYVFFDDNSNHGGSFDNPNGRDQRNAWTQIVEGINNQYAPYPGIYDGSHSSIWNKGAGSVVSTIFGDAALIGKTKVGTGDGLYYINEDGYYEYDSVKHAASYNQSEHKFYIYNQPQKLVMKSGDGLGTAFLPFNGEKDTYSKNGGEVNYWFGLKSTIKFNLASASGTDNSINKDINGNDMVFKFSGDDDVWVVVDGELCLDIGGIHSRSEGYINFQTGECKVGDVSVTKSFNAGEHTLEFYYLERGASDSNCKVQFNITRYGNLKFTKKDGHSKEPLGGAVFRLYRNPECTNQLLIPYIDEQDGQIKYQSYEATSQDGDGLVEFTHVPVGTYYMKEVRSPDDYDNDGRIYTAKIIVEDEQQGLKSQILWNDTPYDQIDNEKRIPLQIEKKWVNAGTNQEMNWPDGYEVSYQVIRHTYLIPGALSVSQTKEIELTGEESVIFTATEDSLLTKDHQLHILTDLPKTGSWTSPFIISDEMTAMGMEEFKAYPVVYRYTVREYPEGSVVPSGSESLLLPVEAAIEDNISIKYADDSVHTEDKTEATENGQKAVLTNTVSSLQVEKEWTDGEDNHTGDSVTVQLYRTKVKKDEGSGSDAGDVQDDEKIQIAIDTKWIYGDGTSAAESQIPRSGKIVVTVSGGGQTKKVELTAEDDWKTVVTDLPKADSSGKNITYTVSYLAQESSFNGVTVDVRVTSPATVTGTNGRVTLNAVVENHVPVNTTMNVPFTVNWKNTSKEDATPPDDARVVATVKNAAGETVASVVLNKDNNWSVAKTLPCIVNDEQVSYTVEYSASGTNVIDADGTGSFSGEGSKVDIVGVVTKPSTDTDTMSIQVITNGLVGANNGNSQWHVNMDEGAYSTNSGDAIRYSFNPSELRQGSAAATVLYNMKINNNSGQQITYRVAVRPQDMGPATLKVLGPNGQQIGETRHINGSAFYELLIPAQGGMFTILIEGENASATNNLNTSPARMSVVKKLAKLLAPLRLGESASKTFDDEISHSSIRLPADAEPVGDPVTLQFNADDSISWKHIWEKLPVEDGEGNVYHYYVKEVSATVGGNVKELGAAYEYTDYSTEDTRIHKVKIENSIRVETADITLLKTKEDGSTALSGAVFTLWKKADGDTEGGGYGIFNSYEKVETGSDGILRFEGLTPGDYKLVEDDTAAGYNLLGEEILFTIDTDGKLTGYTETDKVKVDADSLKFTVKNEPGAVLPHTGGPGTTMLYIFGALLAVFAGAGLVIRKRKEVA